MKTFGGIATKPYTRNLSQGTEDHVRIVQFIDSFVTGGAEVVAMNVAAGLRDAGVECAICALGADGPLRPEIERRGVTTYCVGRPMGVSPTAMAIICGVLLKEKANVVITHHFRQLAHAAIPAALLLSRLVHIEHDFHFYARQPHLLPKLGQLLRFAEAFVSVSDPIRDTFAESLPATARIMRTIPNGIDTDHFREDTLSRARGREAWGFGQNEVIIGTCARLEPVKNIELLIDAFSLVAKEFDHVRLMIIGNGTQRVSLERQAAASHAASRIIFTGHQTDVGEYLRLFDIYSITSRDEGFPLSVLEAMATGLPVVATNVGSVARVVGERTGVLLDQTSSECLASALRCLTLDKKKRICLGSSGRELIKKNYSKNVMVNKYVEILNQTTNRT